MITPTPPRRIVLLGATGSIGPQACDVIARHPQHFRLVGAVVGRDVSGLSALVQRFAIDRCAVMAPAAGATLPEGCGVGTDAVAEVAAMDADVVCVAIPGAAGLAPALTAIDAGRDIALASKEVLVMAGDIVDDRLRAGGGRLFPVDSEHSALWQCLRGEDPATVAKLILTASGGPFLERAIETLGSASPDEALRHPNWDMGPKVTIDSATMMNKGLEIIEAHHLFNIPYERIEVMIHPSSVIHSLVEFSDGATMAQAGIPDMRIPIALALTGGRRLDEVVESVDLVAASPLRFHAVDAQRFRAVELAREAGVRGGVVPAALNAANEVAVAAFLEGRLRFDQIIPTVAATVAVTVDPTEVTLETILAADAHARLVAAELVAGAGVHA